ncbi:MAG: hypothetical protein L3J28_06575 [Candidatus Polarisedimenticolaceae bacterium]|nr:hypothetical protein [Candidatus Polarisedimenticolaceae bacterium]
MNVFAHSFPVNTFVQQNPVHQVASIFSAKKNTFWAFFSQILDADGGCQEVIRKLQAFAAMKSKPLPSSSTAAYCKARKRLDFISLKTILKETAERILFNPDMAHLKGRRVVVVDGGNRVREQ